jgi:alkylation response protein AidB-like acyl-CoA dehydrogenase
MNFTQTETQAQIAEMIRDFANKHIRPEMMEWDESQKFPVEVFRKLGELGLMGVLVPTEYGGSGLGYFEYITVVSEIAKVCGSIGLSVAAHNSLCTGHILYFGNEEQKQKYLVPMASGKCHGAFLLSEPEAGSDATSQSTTAIDMGDHYLLNGTKNWITNGSTATYYLVIAQTDVEKKHKGINAFIVEKNWAGVTVGKKEDKMGIRGSDTHSIMFQDVKVPKENRIGEDGFGFKFAMKTLTGGRIGIAAQALGIASGAYELALAYSKQRKAFGKEIMHHQAIQFKLADMATQIEAARLLIMKAAWLKDNGLDYNMAGSMAKVFASEVAMWVTTEAVQVHGGYGFVKEYHVERLMRDAKITQIYEGTSEVQRIVISREILK